jgi:hypothetical protein
MNKKSHGHFVARHGPGHDNGSNLKRLRDIHWVETMDEFRVVNSSRFRTPAVLLIVPFAIPYYYG